MAQWRNGAAMLQWRRSRRSASGEVGEGGERLAVVSPSLRSDGREARGESRREARECMHIIISKLLRSTCHVRVPVVALVHCCIISHRAFIVLSQQRIIICIDSFVWLINLFRQGKFNFRSSTDEP